MRGHNVSIGSESGAVERVAAAWRASGSYLEESNDDNAASFARLYLGGPTVCPAVTANFSLCMKGEGTSVSWCRATDTVLCSVRICRHQWRNQDLITG